jgi:Beta-ketoacyl synthase, N-terminal domain
MLRPYFHCKDKPIMMDTLSIIAADAVIPAQDSGWKDEIPAHLKRRDPRIWHMAYVAVARVLKTTTGRPKSVMVGTALGALDETKNFLDGIFKDGLGSPKCFIASVHNSMAGKLALEFSIDGPNLTFCDGQNSLASAISACAVLRDDQFPSLIVCVDEALPLLDEVVPRLSPSCREFLGDHHEEGAVALLVDKETGDGSPRLRASGPVFIGDKEIADLTASLFATTTPGAAVLPPAKNKSFIAAGLRVYGCLRKGVPGKTIIGSFSPSSRACAAIELTI